MYIPKIARVCVSVFLVSWEHVCGLNALPNKDMKRATTFLLALMCMSMKGWNVASSLMVTISKTGLSLWCLPASLITFGSLWPITEVSGCI